VLKMARRIFIDTKWNPKKNNNSKKHACYDPEKDVFIEVDSLTELKDYDEIYLDSSIFPDMWRQLEELVSNGKSVYYFTSPWKWKEIRKRFKEELKAKTGRVLKSDKGDAYLLWKVYELLLIKNNTHRYFKPLIIVDVELRPLLMWEELLYKNLQRIRNASMVGVDVRSDIKMLEKMVEDARREIIDKATRLIPGFIDIARGLGLDVDDVNGLTGLAGLLVYNKSTSYQKSIKYLGIYKAKGRYGRRMKKYSHRVQRYLSILTSSILWKNSEYHLPGYRDLRKILKTVIETKKHIDLAGGLGYKPWQDPYG